MGEFSSKDAAHCTRMTTNITATCVLLFFLDPLRALKSESWTSHYFMFNLNLQAVTGVVTQTSRLSAALQSAVRATTGATHTLGLLFTGAIYTALKPR